MEIKRSFDHRGGKSKEAFGNIGSVTLTVPDGVWTLNGQALPFASAEYLATFALQSLQDAYAGAETKADAVSEFTKRITRLIDGNIGVRGNAGVASDDVSKRARSMAKETIKRALVKATGKHKVEELAESDAGKAYFNKRENGWVWNETAVEAFIEKNVAVRDYKAEAQKAIDGENKIAESIEL